MTKIKEWEYYQNGISYNNRLEPSYYDVVDCNWDFFFGRQWRNAKLNDDLPQPVFNNINRFVTFFVASIMASRPAVNFNAPVPDDDDNSDEIVNASWNEFAERVKMDFQAKNALYDGGVTGDYVAHLMLVPDAQPYGGVLSDVRGQIDFELVDGNNFYVANPNSKDIQSQRYVQIAGREILKTLQEEAKEQETIQSDSQTEEQASRYGKIEMRGEGTEKATYVITYKKKTVTEEFEEEQTEIIDGVETTTIVKVKKERKTVLASKCTQDGYIYKDVDLGIELYPVALGNWELQKNTYHGMSFVTAAIPTQIYINRGFALAMYNTLTTAFPKFFYNRDKIAGITSTVGGQIGVNLSPGENISNVGQYIAPGNMSPQVMQMIDMAQSYMKETSGANDALLGNINPEQASGTSIATASKQAGIPLENPKANLYNWLEDIGRIYYNMIANLYGERPVIVPGEKGNDVITYDFSQLKDLYKSVKVDVGPSSYWSELAVIQTLDNLLDRGLIEFIDYLERIPIGYVKDKEGLINKIQERIQGSETIQQNFLNSLTPEQQQRFLALPPEEQEAILNQSQTVVNQAV